MGFNGALHVYKEVLKKYTAHVLMNPEDASNRAQIKRFCDLVRVNKEYAVDTETSGFYWYRDNMVMVQLYTPGCCLVIPTAWGSSYFPADFDWLRDIVRNPTYTAYMWNAKFDMHFLAKYLDQPINSIVVDGYVLARMLTRDEHPVCGLKERARQDLGFDMTDFTDLFKLGGPKRKTLLDYRVEDVATYAAKDPIATWYECKYLLKQLDEPTNVGVKACFWKLEQPMTNILWKMEHHGVVIDANAVEELYEEIEGKLADRKRKIFDALGRVLNINSTMQMTQAMVDLGFPDNKFKRTPTGKRKLDDACIDLYVPVATKKNLPQLVTMLLWLKDYRSLMKIQGTYIIPMRRVDTFVEDTEGRRTRKGEKCGKWIQTRLTRHADGTWRLYPTFNQVGARTGRMSCEDPNMQNWPRPNDDLTEDPHNLGRIRKVVTAPAGYTVMDFDQSQIEIRILAHRSKEPILIDAYMTGKDVHRICASKMFKKKPEDVTPEERQLGKKTTSFGVIFGMSPITLGMTYLNGDIEFAKRIVYGFYNEHRFVNRFCIKRKRFAHKHKYVETMTGRRRWLPNIDSPKPGVVAAAEREVVNTDIQGSAADVVKASMKACDRNKRLEELGVRMLIQIHDELFFICPLDAVEEATPIIQECLTKFPLALKLRVPLIVEGGFGANWYEAH